MIFKPFDKQAEVLCSDARIKCCIAAKRCISADTKVLSLDGTKAFSSISSGDFLLSFDQKANQYSFARSTSSFPKAKGLGFRIIHDKGEFVASESHFVLTSQHVYLPLNQIFQQHPRGAIEQELFFVCPHETILELSKSMWLLNDQSFLKKHANYLDDCLKHNHRYGQRLLLLLVNDQSLFLPLCGALEFFRRACLAVSEHLDVLAHKELIHNHLYQLICRAENYDENYILAYQSVLFFLNLISFDTYEQYLLRCRKFLQFPLSYEFRQNIFLFFQEFYRQFLKPFNIHSFSRITYLEKVSNQEWWDVSVEKTNNYYAEGAIHHNSGKTEACVIDLVIKAIKRPNWQDNKRDPYITAIILPTEQMLKKIAWPKIFQFIEAMGIKITQSNFNKTENRLVLPNGSIIYGFSAEKIQRIEGLKINHILIDEAFQVTEHVYFESIARLSDSQGSLVISGSLGTNLVNPKKHWIYKNFVETKPDNVETFIWRTIDNPYFPQDELDRLKEALDPKTYRALFEIDFNVVPNNLVFDEFDEANIIESPEIKSSYEIGVAIDWGWNHPMSALFCAYDKDSGVVIVFDEIYGSKMTLEQLYDRIMAKPYKINHWYCDAAGGQTREQSGISNIRWFHDSPRNISFKYRRAPLLLGITLIRSFIKNSKGQRKLLIASRCKFLIDEIKNYHYKEKNGEIISELPEAKGEDAVSALRYYFLNRHDTIGHETIMKSTSQFGKWSFK